MTGLGAHCFWLVLPALTKPVFATKLPRYSINDSKVLPDYQATRGSIAALTMPNASALTAVTPLTRAATIPATRQSPAGIMWEIVERFVRYELPQVKKQIDVPVHVIIKLITVQ